MEQIAYRLHPLHRLTSSADRSGTHSWVVFPTFQRRELAAHDSLSLPPCQPVLVPINALQIYTPTDQSVGIVADEWAV